MSCSTCFFCRQQTAYEMRIGDWSSDGWSSDLRAVTGLGLNGFIVNSHMGDLYLDDPRFSPILEAAQALDRPIYLHPRAPSNGMAAPFRDYSMGGSIRSEEHTSDLQSLMRISYAVFCLNKKK